MCSPSVCICRIINLSNVLKVYIFLSPYFRSFCSSPFHIFTFVRAFRNTDCTFFYISFFISRRNPNSLKHGKYLFPVITRLTINFLFYWLLSTYRYFENVTNFLHGIIFCRMGSSEWETLLQKKLAYLPGPRDEGGGPIVVVPLPADQASQDVGGISFTLKYLRSIPRCGHFLILPSHCFNVIKMSVIIVSRFFYSNQNICIGDCVMSGWIIILYVIFYFHKHWKGSDHIYSIYFIVNFCFCIQFRDCQ